MKLNVLCPAQRVVKKHLAEIDKDLELMRELKELDLKILGGTATAEETERATEILNLMENRKNAIR